MYKINKINREKNVIEKIKRAINIVLYIILIPIITMNLTLIIKSFIKPKETPRFFGYRNFIIISESMEPTILVGDAILVKKIPENEIKVKDIISFKRGNEIITHRIVSIQKEKGIKKYITKGDNNNYEDKESITYDKIEGVYQFRIRGFGKFIHMLQNKATFFILIGVIALNYLYGYRLKNKKKERKEKRKNLSKNA